MVRVLLWSMVFFRRFVRSWQGNLQWLAPLRSTAAIVASVILGGSSCSGESTGGTGGASGGGTGVGGSAGSGGTWTGGFAGSAGADAAGGGDAAQDAPDGSDASQDGDTDASADAGATCPIGSAMGDPNSSQPVYFANGANLPSGTYVVTYQDGCMKYDKNSAAQGWTVNATDPNGKFLWWVVGENTSMKLAPLPGNVGYELANGAHKNFLDCVAASKNSAPLTFYYTGGKLGIWLADVNYADNAPGEGGVNPMWRLERVGACEDAGTGDASADQDASPGCTCSCLLNPVDAGGYTYYTCAVAPCTSSQPYCCMCTGVCNTSACTLNYDAGSGTNFHCCSKPPNN